MDLEAPLKPEVLRPLITLVVPGTIATGPFVLVTGHYVPAVEAFWTIHPTAFSVLLGLMILTVGFVIDDVATNIEAKCWDPLIAKHDKAHLDNWKRYLKLQLSGEIVGHRYLRTKLTQMKFELAMPPALVISWTGLLWLNHLFAFWSACVMTFVSLSTFTAAAYLLWESWQTAGLLSSTRALILSAIDDGVKGLPASPRPAESVPE